MKEPTAAGLRQRVVRRVTILAALAMIAGACGAASSDSDTSTTTEAPPSSSTTTGPKAFFTGGAADPVLVIDEEGGFVPVEFILNRLPRYALYGDGTLFSPAPVAAIFPGPILASVQSVSLDATDLNDLARLVEEIGLPDIDRVIDDTLTNRVADATTTIATYFDPERGEHVYGVYALGLTTEGPADLRSQAFSQLLQRLDKAFTTASGSVLYEPAGIQLWLSDPFAGDETLSETLPWPLPATPDDFEAAGDFDRQCLTLVGDAAAAAIEAVARGNAATVWEFEGVEFGLLARPLLPGETGCTP